VVRSVPVLLNDDETSVGSISVGNARPPPFAVPLGVYVAQPVIFAGGGAIASIAVAECIPAARSPAY